MKANIFTHILMATALFTSCAASKNANVMAGEWDVVNLNGTSITPETNVTPFLGFDVANNHVYGFTGCNRLTGQLEASALAKGKADFSRLGCTRMLCQDDQYERAFLQALDEVKHSRLQDERTLQLLDKKGNTIITLRKR